MPSFQLYQLHQLTLHAPGAPLIEALAAALPGTTKTMTRQMVQAGLVTVDGIPARQATMALGETAAVAVDLRHGFKRVLHARTHGEVLVRRPFTILHRDDHLVIIDKAAGILSAPPPGKGLGEKPVHEHVPAMLRKVLQRQGDDAGFIGMVHRLDKDTSGCLVLALTREAQRLLSAQFAGSAAGRTYRALVLNGPRNDADRLIGRIGRGEDGRRAMVDDEDGKETVTRFRVLRRGGRAAELEVTLETGRTHQIRVAMSNIACPVLGDKVYGPRVWPIDSPRVHRLMLHAERLELDHPRTGERLVVTAPLPSEFAEVDLG
jgi:RluA family pseudouridine synthase